MPRPLYLGLDLGHQLIELYLSRDQNGNSLG